MRAIRRFRSMLQNFAAGDAVNVSHICLGLHTATHVDAPNHFIDGTRRLTSWTRPPVGPLPGRRAGRDVHDRPEHLGDLHGVERILFKTRNSAFWNEPKRLPHRFCLRFAGSGAYFGRPGKARRGRLSLSREFGSKTTRCTSRCSKRSVILGGSTCEVPPAITS